MIRLYEFEEINAQSRHTKLMGVIYGLPSKDDGNSIGTIATKTQQSPALGELQHETLGRPVHIHGHAAGTRQGDGNLRGSIVRTRRRAMGRACVCQIQRDGREWRGGVKPILRRFIRQTCTDRFWHDGWCRR